VALLPEHGIPSLELVAGARCYVVVDGVRHELDLSKVGAIQG
jgi:hypothetical protein